MNSFKLVHWGKFYRPDLGGIESITESLAKGAAAQGHCVEVVCFGKPGTAYPLGLAKQPEQQQGVAVWRCPSKHTVASQPLSLRYLLRAWWQGRRAHCVHLHWPNYLAALPALLLPRRVALLLHWHSDVINKGRLATLLAPLEQALLRRATVVVCTSPPYALASQALQTHQHKVQVVPLGVPPPVLAQVLPHVLQAEHNTPKNQALWTFIGTRRVVLAVGRLVPYKGLQVLLEAAQHLPEGSCVVVVGAGPLHGELSQTIARLGLGSRVLLAGRVEDADLQQLFASAALFCLPSIDRAEAFGVVLLEAMAHGLPLVTSNIQGSGVPWVNAAGISGLHVPVGNAQALAQACTQVLGDPALHAALQAGARARYAALFTEARMVEGFERVYAGVVG